MKFVGFSIPMFKSKVPNWNEDKKQTLLSKVKFETLGYVSTDYTQYISNKSGEKFSMPDYKDDFFKILEKPFNDFGSHFCQKFQVNSLWCQKYSRGDSHGIHNHGSLGFSGVFFAQLKSDHKPTRFILPFPDFINGNALDHYPQVDEGDVLFFPSFLLHGADPTNSDEERIIFSFNIDIYPKETKYEKY